MTIATDVERLARRSGPTGSGIAIAGDRTRAFRSARRHSLGVRVAKLLFPLAALLLVVGYVGVILRTVGFGGALKGLPMPRITAQNLTMDNPHYEGFNKDGGRYVVSALTAQQDFAKPGIITLNAIKGEFHQADQTRTDLTASRGVFDSKANRLDLEQTIKVVSTSGLTADLTQATLLVKENKLTSSAPVRVAMPSGTVTANAMTLEQKTRKVTFTDNVRTHLTPQGKTPIRPAGAPDGAAPDRPAASGGPIDIAANRLDIDDAAGSALYSDQVKVVQADSTIETQRMQVAYEHGAKTTGASIAAKTNASKVRHITIDTALVLTRATGERITADGAEVDTTRQLSTLTGHVVVTALPDRRATGDKIEYDQANNTVLLTGRTVHVQQGRNELNGRRILIDRASGRTYVSSPAEGTAPPGHVTATLYQTKAGQPPRGKPSNPPPLPAAAGFATFKGDPNAPIHVDALTLEVDDRAHRAVFKTAVHATQGELSITSDELTAHYNGSTGLSADPAATAAAQAKPASQLNKLEARHNVVVTSAKGQKATGDWADFDAKTNIAVLGGDVRLMQGNDVIRGTRLTIDMTSGESRIETAPGESAGPAAALAHKPPKTAAGAELKVPAQKAGRPSAVFYPRQIGEAAKGAAGEVSGWQSTTTPSKSSPRGN